MISNTHTGSTPTYVIGPQSGGQPRRSTLSIPTMTNASKHAPVLDQRRSFTRQISLTLSNPLAPPNGVVVAPTGRPASLTIYGSPSYIAGATTAQTDSSQGMMANKTRTIALGVAQESPVVIHNATRTSATNVPTPRIQNRPASTHTYSFSPSSTPHVTPRGIYACPSAPEIAPVHPKYRMSNVPYLFPYHSDMARQKEEEEKKQAASLHRVESAECLPQDSLKRTRDFKLPAAAATRDGLDNALQEEKEKAEKEERERIAKDKAVKEERERLAKEKAEKEERERLAKEKAEKEERERLAKEKAEKEERERLAKEKAEKEERERLAKEKAEKEERERLAKEKAEKEERERIAKEKAEKEERERIAKEKAEKEERERLAKEKAEKEERERLAKEKAEKEERERLAKEKAEKEERERLAKEKAEKEERERIAKEKAEKEERERLAKEKAEKEERERLAKEKAEKEERERIAKEKAEKEERERLAKEKAEKEERERLAKEKAEKEERERLAKEKAEKEERERIAKDKAVKEERERLAKEKAVKEERERLAKEKAEKEERERLAKEKAEKEERERLAKEKAEKEERERLAKEKAEKEERERIAKEKAEKEERERLAKEKAEKEERERLAKEKAEKEERERIAKEKAEKEERERIAKEKAEKEERERLAKEKAEKEERERIAKEKAEKEERERLAKEKAEKEERERLAKEKAVKEERERLAKEKAEKEERERLAKEKAEKEERERLAKEKAEKEERERLAKEKAEKEERERIAKDKAEKEERERLAKEKAEKEERERLAKEKAEKEERERLAKEKAEKEERERLAKEKAEKEERERLAKEKAEKEERERLKREEKEKQERDDIALNLDIPSTADGAADFDLYEHENDEDEASHTTDEYENDNEPEYLSSDFEDDPNDDLLASAARPDAAMSSLLSKLSKPGGIAPIESLGLSDGDESDSSGASETEGESAPKKNSRKAKASSTPSYSGYQSGKSQFDARTTHNLQSLNLSMSMNEALTAVVIDLGEGSIKVGMAGTRKPTCILPTVIGKPKMLRTSMMESDMDARYFGDHALNHPYPIQLSRPILHGNIANYDELDQIFQQMFETELRVDPTDRPVFLAVSPHMSSKEISWLGETLFESFGVPGIYFMPTAVASMHSSGLRTGVVVDSGFRSTTITPVYHNHIIPHAVRTLNVGGEQITDHLARLLAQNGVAVGPSYLEWAAINEAKARYAYVSTNYESESLHVSTNTKEFSMPDQRMIPLGHERFHAPEPLFKPAMLNLESSGLPQLIHSSISSVDADLQRELWRNIILSGGNTMISGFGMRLKAELGKIAPRGHYPLVTEKPDRDLLVYRGASTVAGLPSSRPAYLSREDYQHFGPFAAARKFF